MDTGTHLRAVWARKWAVLALALLAAAAVFALRSAATPRYTASADLYLVPGTGPGQDAPAEVDRLTAFYAEIVRDPRVLEDVVRRSGLPLTPDDVAGTVSVTSPGAGRLTVVAEQADSTAAAALANATGEALSAGAAKDQAEAQKLELGPLQSELLGLRSELSGTGDEAARELLQARLDRAEQARIDRLASVRARLDLVRRARAEDAARTPRPRRDATLAFLLVLILSAEAAALLAARRRGIEGGDPALAVARWTSLPVFRAGAGRHGPDETAAALRYLRDREDTAPVYVLALQPGGATGPALTHVAQVAAARHGTTTWVALADAGAAPPDGPAGVTVVDAPPKALGPGALVTASSWTDEQLLPLADRSPGPCALLVDAARVREPQVTEALRVLTLSGLGPRAVLVRERSGRRRTAPA